MVQKDPATGERTAVEVRLFKHALDSLDVIYAHKALVRTPPPRLASRPCPRASRRAVPPTRAPRQRQLAASAERRATGS